MRLKHVLPELTQKMTEDFNSVWRDIDAQYVLLDYLEILYLVNEIYHLPDGDFVDAELRTTSAIRAFLRGHETRAGLIDRLRAILEDYKTKEED
jgi:hypothetical protein